MSDKNKSPHATMQDIAKIAGVSTATVSRTLMAPEKVSFSTRLKVEQALYIGNYAMNIVVRHPRRQYSQTILVITHDSSDPGFKQILAGIEQTAGQYGYLVLIGNCLYQQKNKSQGFSYLLATQYIDGVVLLGEDLPVELNAEKQRHLPPLVMAMKFRPELDLPTVHVDNLTAAFNAVHYLHQLGHQHIACIAGPKECHLCDYRLQGYIQALHRRGITIDSNLIFRGPLCYETGEHAASAFMCLPQKPTAIFCHSDTIALGALHQLKQMGLRVPEDVSLIGFDDIQSVQYCDPPLTTVAQPSYQVGQQAMLLLIEQLQGQTKSRRSYLLESTLVIRNSTAPPKR